MTLTKPRQRYAPLLVALTLLGTTLLGTTLLGTLWAAPGEAQEPASALDQAAAALKRGQVDTALSLLTNVPESERDSATRYLLGRLQYRAGRLRQAAETLHTDLSSLPERVQDDARFRRGASLAVTEGCSTAREVLRTTGGRHGALARALSAQCALALGDYAVAIRELRAVIRDNANAVDTFAARLQLAEALSRSGARTEAKRTLRELLVQRPAHPDAPFALAQLERLGEEVNFRAGERLSRAAALSRAHRHEEAINELSHVRPRSRGERARMLHVRGMALYRLRTRYAEAAEVLERASKIPSATQIEDQFHAARAQSRADHDREAIASYRVFVAQHASHELAQKAEYLAAWLELRLGDAAGERNMRRFLSGPRGRGSSARDAVWHLALRAYETGRFTRAARLFDRYARPTGRGLIEGKFSYWLGRAREGAGERDRAIAAYRQALHVEPLHWYAQWARKRLLALGEEPGSLFPPGEDAPAAEPLAPPTLPDAAVLYARLGLLEDAALELRRNESALRSRAPEGRETESLVAAYLQLGLPSRAYRIANTQRELLRQAPVGAARWAWEGAYPSPWRETIERHAAAQGIDPAYVYATMRQESAYNPGAVSHADAIGLLQMLPSSAERIATRIGIDYSRDLLFDPSWNVRIATHEMRGTLNEFDGDLPLTIAAYNAGDSRVRRWLRETGPIDLDLFVEKIPFDETRGYVRRVMSHFARYRVLRDPESPFVALADRVPVTEAAPTAPTAPSTPNTAPAAPPATP